jgi:hypothetical protein
VRVASGARWRLAGAALAQFLEFGGGEPAGEEPGAGIGGPFRSAGGSGAGPSGTHAFEASGTTSGLMHPSNLAEKT